MCAITAGQRGRTVRVLERAERPGKKILISGGGRCNFTNLYAEPENYLSSEPAFCRSALARYRPRDFIDLVERHGIAYHEKKLGQLFCDGSSREIVAMLMDECAGVGVRVEVNTPSRGKSGGTRSGLFCVRAGAENFAAGRSWSRRGDFRGRSWAEATSLIGLRGNLG